MIIEQDLHYNINEGNCSQVSNHINLIMKLTKLFVSLNPFIVTSTTKWLETLYKRNDDMNNVPPFHE